MLPTREERRVHVYEHGSLRILPSERAQHGGIVALNNRVIGISIHECTQPGGRGGRRGLLTWPVEANLRGSLHAARIVPGLDWGRPSS